MKARYALWPVMIFGAVSLASACSSSSSGNASATGGADGTGDGGTSTTAGTTSATGNTDAAGMSATGDAGAANATPGGAAQGGATQGSAGTPSGTGGAGGAVDLCEGQNLDCADDNNPCTEDACNPATGTCGIPRNGSACDDGVFCNGADSCDAGKCTAHEGNTCTGACNEAGKYCECTTKADCKPDEPGAWGTCDYASTCAETVMRTRPVTKYSCTAGKCVGAAAVESEACNRVTDGLACTDDGNRCNGAEKCKQGSCVPEGVDPCQGQVSTPYCYTTGTECRACTGSGASSVGCGSAQICCNGTCKASGSTCLVIVTTIINPTLIQTISATTLAP